VAHLALALVVPQVALVVTLTSLLDLATLAPVVRFQSLLVVLL
jgi:hypothetical protein